MKKIHIAILLAILIALLAALPALAQEAIPTPSDDEVNTIAKNMYCPVCENVPLDVCPTLACQNWRAQIKEKLEAGWNEQQIYDYFVEQYGDRVLAEPPRRGLNWLIYVVPPIVIVVGLVGLTRYLQNRPSPVAESQVDQPAPTLDIDDEILSRLEAELKRREKDG